MRRSLVVLLALAAVVAACGGDDDDGASGSDGGSGSGSAASGAFPVTIEHKFGSTTIESEPERVVALGYTDLDYVLALGVDPVGARYPQFGDESSAIRPWAEGVVEGADPEVLNFEFGQLGFESIAALQPDLILAVTSGITADEYDTLAAIAPTVAQTDDYIDFGMPWQDVTRLIGQALGRPDAADELVAGVEADFAAARAEHPELEGLEFASAYHGDGEILFFAAEDIRARFFTDLGMVLPAELAEIAGDEFYGSLSAERVDLVDRDVLIWSQLQFTEGGREAIESDPLVASLAATQEGRTVFIGGEVDDAFQVSTVLSLRAALDGIVPMLARAADGDPATVPSPAG